ncbi:hypothetical protein AACH06_20145 [Ideonella sp. DXS29W]|uniref:Uncharacterized protein n=1 Tax=Ideonella lacteola TaxID=2984193 RepID=A0ABU9BT44_9BURK
MSHYLLTRLRYGAAGRITDVAVRQLTPHGRPEGLAALGRPDGLAPIGVGPEKVLEPQLLAGWIAAGDNVYVGRQDESSGAFVIGDEVRPAGPERILESCNIDGARTRALSHLPRLP